jgi:excisionase family DNA binding protein
VGATIGTCGAMVIALRTPREGSVMTQTRSITLAPDERRALRVNDAAFAYGLGRSTVYRLLKEKRLPSIKIAGRRLIPREAMEALLREGA